MRYRGLLHLGVGVLVGVVVGVVGGLLGGASVALPLAWAAGTLTYAAVTWLTIWRLDGEQTREHATSEDIGRPLVDLLVLAAAIVSITAIGLLLVGGGPNKPEAPHVVVGVVAIVGSWLAVHTMFSLRYARRYYSDTEGGIDFNDPPGTSPRYSDFAYLAFTVGMTFQVSDSQITDHRMRRQVLGHALTSFFFITVILAVVINLLGSLAA